MSRQRVLEDGPKCRCGAPAVWSGYCQMEDGRGLCTRTESPQVAQASTGERAAAARQRIELEALNAQENGEAWMPKVGDRDHNQPAPMDERSSMGRIK